MVPSDNSLQETRYIHSSMIFKSTYHGQIVGSYFDPMPIQATLRTSLLERSLRVPSTSSSCL